jgi:putative FmdB family regulatory protein
MPTYEYVCEKCHHQFEVFQSMKDRALEICPKDQCGQKKWGKGKVRRQLGSGAGLIFKGSGFYITDYRSEGYKTAASKDKAPAAASPSTAASTTPAPAAASAPAPASKAGSSVAKPKPTKVK